MTEAIRGRAKPSGSALRLREDAPINRQLVYASPYDKAVYHDRAQGIPFDPVTPGNLKQGVGKIGKYVFGDTSDPRQQIVNSGGGFVSPWPSADCDWTLRFIFEATATPSGYSALFNGAGSTLRVYIKGQVNIYTSGDHLVGPTINAFQVYDLVVTHLTAAAAAEVFLDGVSVGTASSLTSDSAFGSGTVTIWGDPFGNFFTGCRRYLFQAWRRVLTYGEIAALNRDYWLSFTKPGPTLAPSIAAGGGSRPQVMIGG